MRYLSNTAIFVQNVISADRVRQRNEIYNGICLFILRLF